MERWLEKKFLATDPDTWPMQVKMVRSEWGEMRPYVKILQRGEVNSTEDSVNAMDESNDRERIEVPGLNEEVTEFKLPDFKPWEEREAEGLDVDEVDLRNLMFLRKNLITGEKPGGLN